jgi:N utilization substance protein A
VRGTRIKSIIDELNGERIDIIRWNEDPQVLIQNALKPAEIAHIELDHDSRNALVLVSEDQQSLAIGRKGQNVRLATKLTGWKIDIMTRAELERTVQADDAADKTAGEAAAGEAAANQAATGQAPADQASADQSSTGQAASGAAGVPGPGASPGADIDGQADDGEEPARQDGTPPAPETSAN